MASAHSRGLMKILIVDNEEELLNAVQKRLETRGHFVITAGSAEEAFGRIETNDFDLILMDVIMPGMSGAEAIKFLDEKGKLKTPVIFVTGMFSKDGARGINVRGRVYPALAKPFTIDELMALIDKTIKSA